MRRSSTLAGVGDGVLAVALFLLVAGVASGPLEVAVVVASYHLPWSVLALARPAVVHAADQRTVLGLGATLRAAAALVVGLVSLAGAPPVLLLAGAALVAGTGSALADEVEEAMLSLGGRSPVATVRLAGELRRRGMMGMAIAGLPLAGLVYEVAAVLPFVVDMATYSAAALSALAIRRPLPGTGREQPMATGRSAAQAPRTGAVTLTAAGAAGASSAVLGVLPLFAVDDLGIGAPGFGLLLAGLAGAALAGALAAPTFGAVLGLRWATGTALVLSGAGAAAAGVLADPGRPLLGALALGVGAGGNMVAAVLLRALLHASAGRVVEGDAMAAFHGWVWGAVPAGALTGGVVAEAVGVTEAVAVSGLVVALTALTVAAIPGWTGPLRAPVVGVQKIG